jgi:hypothetical protein
VAGGSIKEEEDITLKVDIVKNSFSFFFFLNFYILEFCLKYRE